MADIPLRYHISDWHQLSQCLSNNSRALYIVVSDFIQDDALQGVRIEVRHGKYGTLFATVLDGRGSIVTVDYYSTPDNISNATILNELAKFGFLVEYEPAKSLSADQLEYLRTLLGLHFDKLRQVPVWDTVNGEQVFKLLTVAFQIEALPSWLNVNYAPKQSELDNALIAGTAINISNISETRCYDWSWLTYVANIEDILAENTEPDDSDSSDDSTSTDSNDVIELHDIETEEPSDVPVCPSVCMALWAPPGLPPCILPEMLPCNRSTSAGGCPYSGSEVNDH